MPLYFSVILLTSIITIFCLLYLFSAAISFISGKDLRDNNRTIDVIAFVSIIGTGSLVSWFLGYPKFIYYILAYALLGTLLEYAVGWEYYRQFGSRLYRYYKQELFGFSSIRVFHFWAAAGIYFFIMYNTIMNIPLDFAQPGRYSMLLFAGSFGGIVISTVLASLLDLADKKLDLKKIKEYKLGHYIIFASSFITGPMLVSINYGFRLFLYYVIAMITGVIFEGVLGLVLKVLFGESFWRYYKLDILGSNTSYVVTPLWLGATSLALLLIYLVL